MSAPDPSNLQAYKVELIDQAKRGGALVAGVADATAFHMAPGLGFDAHLIAARQALLRAHLGVDGNRVGEGIHSRRFVQPGVFHGVGIGVNDVPVIEGVEVEFGALAFV